MAVLKSQNQTHHEVSFHLFGEEIKKIFECEKKAFRFLDALILSDKIDSVSIGEAVQFYLKNESEVRKSKTSVQIDYRMFTFFLPHLETLGLTKDSSIKAIRPYHLTSFKQFLKKQKHRYSGEDLSNATLNRMLHTLKNFFTKSEEMEWIAKSPAKFLKMYSYQQQRRPTWSEDDLQVCMTYLWGVNKSIYTLLCETGARISSVLNLKWSDIDFHNELITYKTRKGASGDERLYKVPMTESVRNILEKLSAGQNSNSFVFLDRFGERINPSTFSKRFLRVLKQSRLNAKSLTLHGLRHIFASRLNAKGVPTEVVRLLLGHSSVKTTQLYIETKAMDLREWLLK